MKFITIVYMYYSYKMFQNTAFCQAQMGKFCSLQNKFFLQCVVCDFVICCKWLLYIYYE